MYKITNIEELGTSYNVVDRNGRPVKTVQVIQQDEILEAALGPWEEGESVSEYLKNSIAVLEGFEAIEPHTTMWLPVTNEKLSLVSAMEYAITNGYDRIIVEYLDPVDDIGNFLISLTD